MAVGRNVPTTIQTSLISIKSVIYWINLKLGVVVAWTISVAQKVSVAI